MKAYLICLLMLFSIVGCTVQPERSTLVVEKKTMMVLKADQALLQPCAAPEPPSIDSYMALSREGREDALVRYGIEQITSTKACSRDKQTIRLSQDHQQIEVDKFNKEEDARAKALVNEKGK